VLASAFTSAVKATTIHAVSLCLGGNFHRKGANPAYRAKAFTVACRSAEPGGYAKHMSRFAVKALAQLSFKLF
jgi:hypothetical protein